MKLISFVLLWSFLVVTSCSKKEDDDNTPSNNNTGNSPYSLDINSAWQVKAKIDSADYTKADGNGAAGFCGNDTMPHTDPDSIIYNYGSLLMDGSFTFSHFTVL